MWYEKFKKVIKVVAVCLFLALVAGSYIFYFVCPEQALTLLQEIKDFADRPLPIIGFGIGTLAGAVLLVISKTSVGKRAVNKAKTECESVKKEFSEFKEESTKQIETLKLFYEEKIALVEYNRKVERESFKKALSYIHNVGVQHELENMKSLVSYEGISEVVDVEKEKLEKEFETKFEAFTQALIADYEKKIAELGTKPAQEPTESAEPIESPIEEIKVE